jgi:DNA-binding NtrC family response regulator
LQIDELEMRIARAVRGRTLEEENVALRQQLDTRFGLENIIGEAPVMQEVFDRVKQIATVRSTTVLILGESGTGKELIAKAIHQLSPRSKMPLVTVHCAALSPTLLESELFGHERGAFTGANVTRKGAFEAAHGGTLFLDEIGDLPPAAQAKLLRVLEERKVTRLGGNKTIDVNTRVIAATHRDLEKEVSEGRFREDLFYRLNVHVLRVPPLRDRLSDVPALVEHLVASTCERFGMRRKTVAHDVIEALMSYDWRRNNIRELRNVVERMLIATDGDALTRDAVPPEIRQRTTHNAPRTTHDVPRTFEEQKVEAERQIVIQALERNDWHVTNTAKELGLSDHASLLKIMRRLGVQRDAKGPDS